MLPRRLAALLLMLIPLAAGGAAADWLVTVDGERIETKGPWQVRGPRVVFTTPAGTLASIRLAAVDLAASEEATKAATSAPEAATPKPAPAQKEPVLVLTDADVSPAAPPPAPAEGDAETATTTAAAAPTSDSLQVVSWSDTFNPEAGQLEVSGEVRNQGQSMLTRFELSVLAYDEAGNLIGRAEAEFEKDMLRPGDSSPFTAVFADLTRADTLRFSPISRGLVTRQSAAEGEKSAETPPPTPP